MPSTKSPKMLPHKWQFEAIGTVWQIETVRPVSVATRTAVALLIDEYDRVYSRFRDDSQVANITAAAGTYDMGIYFASLIELYRLLYELTGGAVSPLVGGMLAAVGYDKDYSLRPGAVPEVPVWDEVLSVDGSSLTVSQPVLLDFGAVGKGQLIDAVGELLEQHDHTVYVVDASGDMRIRGATQRVGLENPFDTSMVVGMLPLGDGSICASATNRRAWGDWHHVVDPRAGAPVRDIVATWAATPTTMLADGLATALFFVTPANVQQSFGGTVQLVRLRSDGGIEYSPNFVGELYL